MIYRRAGYPPGGGYGSGGYGSGGFGFGGIGSGAPVPRDVIVILVALFVTFSMQFFQATAWLISLLTLNPAVLAGQLWRLVTYPFIGNGPPSFWYLIELLMVYWFGRDAFRALGRRRFWQLLLAACVGGAVAASLVQLVLLLGFGQLDPRSFLIMQGQHMLTTVLIVAFSRLYGEATLLLFFIVPIKARWFLWMAVAFAFLGFLGSHDLAGFVGLVTGIFIVAGLLTPGGMKELWRRGRLQLRRQITELRLARLRRKRRHFDILDGDGPDHDRWVH